MRGLEARFESAVLPLFARRTQEVGQLLPELYLHGLSQGDFELALRGLLGEGAPLSKSSIAGRPRARLRLGGRHRAPRGAREPGGMQGPTNGLSQQPVEAGGSLTLGAQVLVRPEWTDKRPTLWRRNAARRPFSPRCGLI